MHSLLKRSRVPFFYFHIVGQTVVLDDSGASFGDAKAALHHARQMAHDLRHDLDFGGSVVVENNDTGELFEVPMADFLS